MKFQSFQYLWLLWFVIGLFIVCYRADNKRKLMTQKIISLELWDQLLPHLKHNHRKLKIALVTLGLVFIVLGFCNL